MRLGLIIVMVLLAAACSRGESEPDLLNIRQDRNDGPDEFAVLPTKPLQMPEDFATLPAPTPGGTNITDPTPHADVAAALGGNAAVLSRASTDGALVTYVGRFGVDPTIRERLAASDLEYRRNNDGRLLERIFNTNVYYSAYEAQSLDQYSELERLRRLGIRTSSVPPNREN